LRGMYASRRFAARSRSTFRCGSKYPTTITACARSFRHGRERALEVVDAADDGRDESKACLRCRRPQVLHERTAERIGRRGCRENGHAVEVRDQPLEELEALAADLRIDARQARHVPA